MHRLSRKPRSKRPTTRAAATKSRASSCSSAICTKTGCTIPRIACGERRCVDPQSARPVNTVGNGTSRQEVIGRVHHDNFLGETDGEDRELTGPFAPTAVAIRDGKALQAQISLRHKTGHRVPVQLWAFPIRNAEGAIIGVAESFEKSVSVTDWDRRQTKLALRMYRSGQRRSQSRDDSVSCAGKSGLVCRASRPVFSLVHSDRSLGEGAIARWTWRHRGTAQPVAALSTMADELPGLGIVAAVLGVVSHGGRGVRTPRNSGQRAPHFPGH